MPQLLRKEQLGLIVSDEKMMATPLFILCVDVFGTGFFEWEPQTFDVESQAAFGTKLPEVNRDKIWSLVTLLTTNLFYVSLESFIPIANALNGEGADFSNYDPVTADEAGWAIVEAALVDPPEGKQNNAERYGHDVKRYIGAALAAEGITTPPKFLQPYAEYDRDPEEQVGLIVGPDEHMLQMHETRQSRERDEIEQYVRNNLATLVEQIRRLPLRSGNATAVGEYLQRARTTLTGLPTPEGLAAQPSVVPA